MSLGIPYLGFLIPIAVTLRHFTRDSTPTRGECAACQRVREITYCAGPGDKRRYCHDCIDFALASDLPREEGFGLQFHPAEGCPVERVLVGMEPVPSVIYKAFL